MQAAGGSDVEGADRDPGDSSPIFDFLLRIKGSQLPHLHEGFELAISRTRQALDRIFCPSHICPGVLDKFSRVPTLYLFEFSHQQSVSLFFRPYPIQEFQPWLHAKCRVVGVFTAGLMVKCPLSGSVPT